MTMLPFPARTAVGEVWWEDAREPNGSGHRLAIGVVEVPDGTAVSLHVYTVVEVSVSDRAVGICLARQTGAGRAGGLARRKCPGQGYPARYVEAGRAPAARAATPGASGAKEELQREQAARSRWTWSSSAACPGQRLGTRAWGASSRAPSPRSLISRRACGSLGVYLDNLGGDAPSVIAELKALESLRLYGDSAMDEGRRARRPCPVHGRGPAGPGIPGTSQRGIHRAGPGATASACRSCGTSTSKEKA